MTKDEMKNRISMALKDPILQQGFECICKENAVLKDKIGMLDLFCGGDSFKQRRLDTFIQIADYIEKLEAQISVLLSCKNCLENKGGFICQKEYENKCLAQKIQFIKELQEEIAELKTKLEALEGQTPWKDIKDKSEVVGKLTKTKEIIKKFSEFANLEVEYDFEHPQEHTDLWDELCKEAEQFLKEN